MNRLPGYDAWKTKGPPDNEYCEDCRLPVPQSGDPPGRRVCRCREEDDLPPVEERTFPGDEDFGF